MGEELWHSAPTGVGLEVGRGGEDAVASVELLQLRGVPPDSKRGKASQRREDLGSD